MEYTILVIEDEPFQLMNLSETLEKQGYNVLSSESSIKGIRIVQEKPVDLVLTDFKMPEKNGLEVLREVKQINPDISVIIITAYGDVETAVKVMKEGAFDYLTKPIEFDELDIIIKKALERKMLVSENRELRRQLAGKYRFDEIIYADSKMEEVINTAGRAADSKASILIYGESGTGKELIAKAIHYASPRRDKPLISVNCAALNENLLESELFGHEKGAFTGADRQRKGRFELADGGTIFLDEVGEIPLATQVKLLRVLQEREFERVGGNETIHVDVRVISATNKDIEDMIKKGIFREDLYYRLNVISVRIPPLRERKSDILPLISYFIAKYSKENNKEVESLSKEAMDALIKYNYPGNVRELENALERAIIMARGKIITLDDLPIHIRTSRDDSKRNYELKGETLDDIVENVERQLIADALAKTKSNQSRAAEILGISERNLRYKIKKYGMKK